MFSLTSLKCFAAAAEELNFTRAAKRLFISQQALSSHISKLEEYYGVRLFDRGIPMTLTDAGRALQKHAREILSSVDDYAREVQDIKNFRQGELTVGIPVTRGPSCCRPCCPPFISSSPDPAPSGGGDRQREHRGCAVRWHSRPVHRLSARKHGGAGGDAAV